MYYLRLLLLFKNKFQPKVCDGCHDLMQEAMSFNNVTIDSANENNHRTQFLYISKDTAINIMKNSDLKEKSGSM